MTRTDFFPDLTFGWAFAAVMIGFLVVASYSDYRYLIIPKKLTIPFFFCGVLFNLLRGGWLASKDASVWILGKEPGMVLGTLDGLLFALSGFAVCFGLFFVMFIVGACRGGDVKLVAATGAWLGLTYSLMLFIIASVLLIMISGLVLVANTITYGYSQTRRNYSQKTKQGQPKHRLMSYSFPIAVAASVLLGWILMGEMNRREGSQHSVTTHRNESSGRTSSEYAFLQAGSCRGD